MVGGRRASLSEEAYSIVFKFHRYLEEKHGSVLRAWRAFFDRDNDRRIGLHEFEHILRDHGYPGDPHEVFAAMDSDGSGELALVEVHPGHAKLWQDFSTWFVATFKRVGDVFWRLGGPQVEQLTENQFVEGIVEIGWNGGSEQLLFGALDTDGVGYLTQEKFKWVEIESKRMRRKTLARQNALMVVSKKNKMSERKALLDTFKHFLIKQYGAYVRAWRIVLNPGGVTGLQKSQFFKACVEAGWTKDVRLLWKACGKDDISVLRMEDIDLRTAAILARFRAFMRGHFGNAQAAFQALDKLHVKKVRYPEFLEMMTAHDLQGLAKVVFRELDLAGRKYLTVSDFIFLECWEPLGYLLAKPDHQAAKHVKALLVKIYGNLIKAWRRALDPDSSNYCNWDEFQAACKTIGFKGDVAGAWRAFHKDLSGHISLQEIDPTSNEILVDFRRWAHQECGNVRSAFHLMDPDGSGKVTVWEFRRSCRIYGFDGDARLVFRSLDNDGKGSLSLGDMIFLDRWQVEESPQPDVVARSYAASPIRSDGEQVELPVLPVPTLRKIRKAAVKAADTLENLVLPPIPTSPKNSSSSPRNKKLTQRSPTNDCLPSLLENSSASRSAAAAVPILVS